MGIVYRIPCKHCNNVYVGEAGRTAQKRIAEHRTAVTEMIMALLYNVMQGMHIMRKTAWEKV